MTDPLSRDRFRELADAYGGVIAGWPKEYRAAAAELALRPEAAALLTEALALDGMLDEWRVPLPATRLVASIVAAGPVRRARSRIGLWWSGIGIAATLAGAAAGMAAVAMIAPAEAPPPASTSFGDVAGQDG